MFVLDTNTVIYFFKGMGAVSQHLLATPPSEIAIPAIVLFELETGLAKSSATRKRRKQLDLLVSAVQLLPFAAPEARAAARVRSQLEPAGVPIGPLDNLIAGTALAHGGTLVTHNVREFSRVEGLQIVDWFDSPPP